MLWPYVEGSLTRDELAADVAGAYATFDHPDVCPLVEVEGGLFVQELFHGPTFAFKDVALQLVGRLFDRELQRRGRRATIVVATSGDTGSAAIAACVGRPSLDVVVLHPEGRVSDVQRRQMTTVDAPNVHNVAVMGNFDDCQDLVKALFADPARRRLGLSAMNSINWARVAAQVTYYVTAAATVGRCEVAVPTGNFGNVLAGWIARRGGAAIEGLVIGTNSNDILTRWVASGALVADQVVPTLSPSMDIAVSSNHERLLFELLGRDGAAVAELLGRFRALGSVEAPVDPVFSAAAVDDAGTRRHDPAGVRGDRLRGRPPHRGGHRRRRRGPPAPRPAARVPGNGAPGEVPRRGRPRHRHAGPSRPRPWPGWPTCPSTT